MKRLLQLGFILGLGGTLAAAYFGPWFEYERVPSATGVVANGGRVEQFMVRLPADRIADPVTAAGPDGAANAARLEHFKLRDVTGKVIGLVARHELEHAGEAETAWLLTIPSRGAVALASSGTSSVDSALAGRGLVPGQSLEPELSVDIGPPAQAVAATGEFADVDFSLVETWTVTGLDVDGRIRGTLHLNTTARRSP